MSAFRHCFGLVMLPPLVMMLLAPVAALLANLWVGLLLAVVMWPLSLVLLVVLLPIGPFGRMLTFVVLSPLPLGRRLPAAHKDEHTLIRQHFASGAIGSGLCMFSRGLHVSLTDRRLVIELASILPGVCLLALDHAEIQDVQPCTWNCRPRSPALAFSLTHEGHSARFVFLPRDRTAWLRACEQAELAVRQPDSVA